VFEADVVIGERHALFKADGYTFGTNPMFLMITFILGEMLEEAGRNR
jgi:hypothetical protein